MRRESSCPIRAGLSPVGGWEGDGTHKSDATVPPYQVWRPQIRFGSRGYPEVKSF